MNLGLDSSDRLADCRAALNASGPMAMDPGKLPARDGPPKAPAFIRPPNPECVRSCAIGMGLLDGAVGNDIRGWGLDEEDPSLEEDLILDGF